MERLKQKDRTEAEDRGAQGERGGAAEGKEKVKEGAQWRRLGVGGRGTRRRRWRSWGNGWGRSQDREEMIKVQTTLSPWVGVGIDYNFLREVEIYVTDIEYRTCFFSSQDSGKSWWPSKCYKWTSGLKSGYQQVREVFNFISVCLLLQGSLLFKKIVLYKTWYDSFSIFSCPSAYTYPGRQIRSRIQDLVPHCDHMGRGE